MAYKIMFPLGKVFIIRLNLRAGFYRYRANEYANAVEPSDESQ